MDLETALKAEQTGTLELLERLVEQPSLEGNEAAIRAFRVPGQAGINYRAGAWHAHLMTVSAPGTFAMLVHEDGTPEDCVFAAIAPVTLGAG